LDQTPPGGPPGGLPGCPRKIPKDFGMFGPYEVVFEGRKYFGNLSLREFHMIASEDGVCLYDVEAMAARTVTAELAALAGQATAPGALVPEPVMEALRELGLVRREPDAPAAPQATRDPAGPKSKPEFSVCNLGLFVAQQCNMRCVYCYGGAGEYGDKGLMDEPTARRAVDWLIANSGAAGKINIGFFGGEPLLAFPLIAKVVAYARQKAGEAGKQVSFNMTTNGTLITEEIADFLAREEILPLVSYDGPPEVQNRQRPFKDGSGSHDTVAANVTRLLRRIPSLACRATLVGDPDPAEIVGAAKRAGFASCFISPASPAVLSGTPAPGGDAQASADASRRMIAFYRAEFAKLLASIRERALDKRCLPALLPQMTGLVNRQKRHHGCGVGKGIAAVTTNGDVYPCHRFAGLEFMRQGNIAGYRAGACNDYHRRVVDSLPVCRACWARYLCGGGCLYHNLATTGDILRPPEADCLERKTKIEGVIEVYCRLTPADKEYVVSILEFLKEPDPHP
jgi:uncharacterized protein